MQRPAVVYDRAMTPPTFSDLATLARAFLDADNAHAAADAAVVSSRGLHPHHATMPHHAALVEAREKAVVAKRDAARDLSDALWTIRPQGA